MVTKNQIKTVKSLQQKKYRNQLGLFVVEGRKVTEELLQSHFVLEYLFATDAKMGESFHPDYVEVGQNQMKQMSGLTSSSGVLAVFRLPERTALNFSDWILALDAVRDPGNLGTIIRICDWFNIPQIVASEDTVDCYNPKVLQASMGSIARVNIVYRDLKGFLQDSKTPVYGTYMEGENVFQHNFPDQGVIVMGNEANGISEGIGNLCGTKLSIPQYGEHTTESLNVAVATAITLGALRGS
ncbi:MAG: RNA methyltransferase [Bacteroidota bacterium]